MERSHRFAVTALGAVTLSAAVGVPRRTGATGPRPLNGQTAPAIIWHFDSLTAGQPPAGFSFGRTGGGRVGHWIVQSAPDAPSPPNVLAQVDSDRTDYRFPVAAAPSPSFTDGSVTVKCKPVSGHVDRASGTSCVSSSKGIMWRCTGTARGGSTRTTARSVVPVAWASGPRPTRTPCSTTSPRGRGSRSTELAPCMRR